MPTHTADQKLRDFVLNSDWSRGLTQQQLDRLFQDVGVKSFKAGETICARHTPSHQWFGVLEGMVRVETVGKDGQGATFAGVPSGAWFGEGAVLKGEPRPYEVAAIRDSMVVIVPRTTFMWLVEQSHPFALWLIQQLNARLGYYVALVQSFRLNNTTAQVAYCLAELFSDNLYPNPRKKIAISQQEIGRLSGLSRQIVNRALRDLHDQGVILLGYGNVEVLDLAALDALARGQ